MLALCTKATITIKKKKEKGLQRNKRRGNNEKRPYVYPFKLDPERHIPDVKSIFLLAHKIHLLVNVDALITVGG